MPNADLWKEFSRKVEFLKQTSSFSECPASVESIETHMSWIFLTDKYAYKIKKPNVFRHLKLDTLAARFLNSQNEVELNEALAPGYYLGLVPLTLTSNQQLHLGNHHVPGEVVDWLVKMRRIPLESTLDRILAKKEVPGDLLEEVAHLLVYFYLAAEPAKISPHEYLSRVVRYVEENFEALSKPQYELDQSQVAAVHQAQLATLQKHKDDFLERVEQGKIIEGHGDLRPEHICLTTPPVIIDRLEFSAELRTIDPLDELSYLNLECTMMGETEVGKIFLRIYQEMSQDFAPQRVTLFYQSFRACLRAKISVWHLDDSHVVDKEKWKGKARSYLNLAKVIL